ncbi:hypothetical protein XELAEV_18000536mg [Xenopus laevis]|nr:hypothetical protein XELAEV_18000536mg [Xenopus laevis]
MNALKSLSNLLNSSLDSCSFNCSQICFCCNLMDSNSSILCFFRSSISLQEHSCRTCYHCVLNSAGVSSNEGKICMRKPLGTMRRVMYSSKQITFQNTFSLLRKRFLLLAIRCESVRLPVLGEAEDPEKTVFRSLDKATLVAKRLLRCSTCSGRGAPGGSA